MEDHLNQLTHCREKQQRVCRQKGSWIKVPIHTHKQTKQTKRTDDDPSLSSAPLGYCQYTCKGFGSNERNNIRGK